MKVKELKALEYLGSSELLENEVKGIFLGDLLSYVMASGKEGEIWVTVQAHLNCLAVASLKEFKGIIIAKNEVTEDFILKANEEGIAVFKTDLEIAEVARYLIELGL